MSRPCEESAGTGDPRDQSATPCFTPGTLIMTPKGQRPVQDLRPGDMVLTRDNGMCEITWTGTRDLDSAALVARPDLRPVTIRAGSLGNGLPLADMAVSPNHRFLVCSDAAADLFGEREVLSSAKHLVDGDGIRRAATDPVTYVHFMFEQHEVVLADGAWTESFQPAVPALSGLARAQRREILDLFPELDGRTGTAGFAPARRILGETEMRQLRIA